MKSQNKDFLKHAIFLTRITISFFIIITKRCLSLEIDGWEKFNEMSLPEKEDFCSHLNMEHFTDEDYAHGKRDFEIKKRF